MAFVVGWVVVLLLLALWSGLVASGHALLVGVLAHTGSLGGVDWNLPESVTALLPVPVAEWLVSALETWTPQLHALVDWLPALSGGVTLLAWVVWGLGALFLLVVGLAVHVAIALWRKSRQSTPPRPVALLR